MPRLALPDRLEPLKDLRESCFQHLLAQLHGEYEQLQHQNSLLQRQLRELGLCSPCVLPFANHVPSPQSYSPRPQLRPKPAAPADGHSAWRRGCSNLDVVGATPSMASRRPRRGPATPHGTDRASRHAAEPPRRQSRSSEKGDKPAPPRRSSHLQRERDRLLTEQFCNLDVNQTGRLSVEDLRQVCEDDLEEPLDMEGLLGLLQVFSSEELSETDDDASQVHHKEPGMGLQTFVLLMDENESFPQLEPKFQEALEKLRAALLPQLQAKEEVLLLSSLEPRRKERDPSSVFWWEVLPTTVILLNALLTGLSTDLTQYENVWEAFEAGFAFFYLVEFITKLCAFGPRWYFWGPEFHWNIFDVGCLCASLADLAVEHLWSGGGKVAQFTMIKIFRLARLGRLIRTLRFKAFQELKLMVFGVLSGLRVLTWAVVLLVLLIYLVGVGMTSVMGTKEPEFETVVSSMFTLFRCWTDGCSAYDGSPLPERLRRDYGMGYVFFHILLTMFVTVGVFNLIMAIFVDNVVNAQQMRRMREIADKSKGVEMKLKRQLIKFVNQGTQQECNKRRSFMDHARDTFSFSISRGSMGDVELHRDIKAMKNVSREWDQLMEKQVLITRDVFRDWLEDEDFQLLLDEAEIEMTSYFELFDVLDADMGGMLSMDELITGLMQLRGPMTKSDLVAVRLMVEHLTKLQEDQEV